MTSKNFTPKVVVIGAGYGGLAAAYELRKGGAEVVLIEQDKEVGGLASAFDLANGKKLEKFYHHWFTSDRAILKLLSDLELDSKLRRLPSNNGFFYANSIFRLTSPWDLLRFKPLPLVDRIRTGLLAIYARKLSNWQSLEGLTAFEWIRKIAGQRSFEIIWQPLIRGKFGQYAERVSAVWFWNKLKLRGSSRDAKGSESLLYFDGGFAALTDAIYEKLISMGVEIKLNTACSKVSRGSKPKVYLTQEIIEADAVLISTQLPDYLRLDTELSDDDRSRYQQIPFLGNICLVLELKESLSQMYWLNVADPSFPFVGIIEHTRLDTAGEYGSHLVYLSKYLPCDNELYQMNCDELVEYSLPHLQRMFPAFTSDNIIAAHLWKAEYSQPVVIKNYSSYLPPHRVSEKLWLATMAQIYPEDRGTNYAVKQGREVAAQLLESLRP